MRGVCHTANRRGIGCLNCVTFVIRDLRRPGMLRRVHWLFAVHTVWPLNMGPIGCPDAPVIASLRCVTSRKSDDHIYSATEARGHANYVLCTASLTSGHPKVDPFSFCLASWATSLACSRTPCFVSLRCIALPTVPNPDLQSVHWTYKVWNLVATTAVAWRLCFFKVVSPTLMMPDNARWCAVRS